MAEHFLDDQRRLTESEEINVDGNLTHENKIAHDAAQLCPHSMAPHSLAQDQKLARNIGSEPDMESAYGTGSHSAQVDDENDSIANGTKIQELRDEVERVNAERDDMELRNRKLEDELKKSKKDIDDFVKMTNAIEIRNRKLEDELKKSKKDIDDFVKMTNAIELRKITLEVQNVKCLMKDEVSRKTTRLNELEFESMRSKAHYYKRIQELRDEVERVNAERDDMELRFATNKTQPPKTSSVQTQTQQTLEMQTRPTMTMRMQQALASSGVRPFVIPLRFPIQETAQHGDFQEAQQEEEDDGSSELCLQ